MTDVATAIGAAATPSATAPPPAPATRAPAQAASPASRPGAIDDRHFDGLSAAEQANYARVRKPGENGGAEWVHRDQLSKEPTPASASGDPAAAQPGEAPTVTADGKLKVGSYELSADDVAMLMQTKAATDLKATQVPADPAGYEAKLPEGLKLPDGVEFHIDTADPVFKDFQALAKKVGLSREEFSSFVGLFAAKTAASEAHFRASMKAELDKLGDHATMRVTALQSFFRGHVGDDLAKAVTGGLFSAKQVEAMEIIARKMGSQGAASFSQAHREPGGQPGRVSEAEYNAMSQAERYQYAKSFDQKQFR